MNRQTKRAQERKINKIHSNIQVARQELAQCNDGRKQVLILRRVKGYLNEMEKLGVIRKRTRIEKFFVAIFRPLAELRKRFNI